MRERMGHLAVWAEVLLLAILWVGIGIRHSGQSAEESGGNQVGQFARETGSSLTRQSAGTAEEAPCVALTFDDGPNNLYTPRLLEGLKKRNIHATFFLMGKNIEGKEDLVLQMRQDGHLIGNHTYNHVELDKISKAAAKKEILQTNESIWEITGIYPEFLRPPYGVWQKNLDFYVTMFPVLWDIDTLDWKSKNVDSVLQIISSEVKDGSIILMHDGYESSVEAALRAADLLTERGYEFVTVDKLLLP